MTGPADDPEFSEKWKRSKYQKWGYELSSGAAGIFYWLWKDRKRHWWEFWKVTEAEIFRK